MKPARNILYCINFTITITVYLNIYFLDTVEQAILHDLKTEFCEVSNFTQKTCQNLCECHGGKEQELGGYFVRRMGMHKKR